MNKNIKLIFVKNFSNLTINQVVNILVAIVVTPILFQNLGQSSFGLVNFTFSIFMLLSIVVSYGYHLNGPKKISLITKINDERDLINDLISLRLIIALIISGLIISIGILTDLFDSYLLIILFSIPILFSEAIHPIF